MAIDPSKFHPINVVDTCAVWNILSSRRLNAAAKEAQCDFCVTSFVQYECLAKRRTSITASQQALIDYLRAEQGRGSFQAHSCGIEDLQSIELLEQRKRLGKGELSSIAFAIKIRQAFMTDDRKALRLAKESGHLCSQTTPHLFSWLIFSGRLGDGDKDIVLTEHVEADGDIARHLDTAYELALECRLNSMPKP